MTLFGSSSHVDMVTGGAIVSGFAVSASLGGAYWLLEGGGDGGFLAITVVAGLFISIVEYFNNEFKLTDSLGPDKDWFKNTSVGQLREWLEDARPSGMPWTQHVMDYLNPGRFWGIFLLIFSLFWLKVTSSRFIDQTTGLSAFIAFVIFIVASVTFAPYGKLDSFSWWAIVVYIVNIAIGFIYAFIVYRFQAAEVAEMVSQRAKNQRRVETAKAKVVMLRATARRRN